MRYGALHDPTNPALDHAVDYSTVRVGRTVLPDPNWFEDWNWPATGNMLANDELSDCCEAADLVLVEGFRAAEGLPPLPPDQLTELVKLRYAEVAGWDGTSVTDNGTIPAEDCFAWQTVPIFVAGDLWRVRWCSVPVVGVFSALRRGPLQLTLGLTAEDQDDVDLWHKDPHGEYTVFHRVVAGAQKNGQLICRTYGLDVPVAHTRVVAADLLLRVDAPAELRSAGIDWTLI